MSLSEEKLKEHCQAILKSPRIKNKIVVLCEGSIKMFLGERLSPQLYKKMEDMPDANFYNSCIPKSWRNHRPEFFNCGDRVDVINTYFSLLDLHEEQPLDSYLTPGLLFAIIDLDVQNKQIEEDYDFSCTEAIFQNLYYQTKVNEKNAKNHRIWITGLIHKEAYFFMPEVEEVFNIIRQNFPTYQDEKLVFDNLYLDLCNQITNDLDLIENFSTAMERINYQEGLDFSDLEKFRDSWKNKFEENRQNFDEKRNLICLLLMITKAKPFWKKIIPFWKQTAPNYLPQLTDKQYREQLSLEIGRFYATLDNDSCHHIPYFLKILKEFIT